MEGNKPVGPIVLIKHIAPSAKTEKKQLKITLYLAAAKYDAIPAVKLFMPAALWNDAFENAMHIVEIAKKAYPRIRF